MVHCANCGRELPPGAAFCPSCGRPASQTVGPAAVRPRTEFDRLIVQPRLQELWLKRVFAFIIDTVIVGIAVGVVELIFFISSGLASGVIFPFNSAFASPFSVLGLVLPGVTSVLVFFYFVILESTFHKTLGKAALGLRVATTDGTSLDAGRVFLRNISKVYWVLLLLDLVGGLVTPVQSGQKYSDHIANTNVVLGR